MLRDKSSGPTKRTVAPTLSPVTLEDAKNALDIIDDSSDDYQIDQWARDAGEIVETDSRRVLMSQTWQMYLDEFPCEFIELRKTPVTAVSFIKYYTGGVLTTLSSNLYEVDLISEPARIRPVHGQTWPCTDCRVNAVQIEWVAGYTTQASVPRIMKAAVLHVMRQLYHGCELGSNYKTLIDRIQKFGFLR